LPYHKDHEASGARGSVPSHVPEGGDGPGGQGEDDEGEGQDGDLEMEEPARLRGHPDAEQALSRRHFGLRVRLMMVNRDDGGDKFGF